MKISKVKISQDVTIKLRNLHGKTGLTPNILLRVGFGLSLQDSSHIDPVKYPQDGMELNRYTITGEFDKGFVALLREWLVRNRHQIADNVEADFFRAHLNRGAILLSARVKSLTGLTLIEK